MAKPFDKTAFQGGGRPGNPEPMRAVQFDPLTLARSIQGFRAPSPRSLGFFTLREMARVTQPVAAIVRTRQNQVARFGKLPRFDGDLGIHIRMKDPDAKPSKGDKKQMHELSKIVLACGRGPDPDGVPRPSLDPMLRMLTNDSLILDASALELREDRKGNLFDWFAVDAATIRLTVPSYKANQAPVSGMGAVLYNIEGQGYGGVSQPANADIVYVQMINNTPYAEFTRDEMAYWVRNPRTDIEAGGYGYGELEQLVEIVTGYLNAMLYNNRYFTHSSIPEGILSVTGNYSPGDLDDFRRHWNAMVSGVNNSWRVPILATKDGKGATWQPMKANNKEMMFHEWMDFLTRISCAIYQIDPEELGMGGKGVGEGGGLGGGDGGDETLKHSLAKGLHPILTRFEAGINDDILPKLAGSEDFIFGWAGVDPDQEDKKLERTEKKINIGLQTVNDARAEYDMELVPDEALWGDAPANTTLYQAWAMGQQAQLQAAGFGDDGSDQEGEAQGGEGLPQVNPDGTEEPDEDAPGAAPPKPGAAGPGAPPAPGSAAPPGKPLKLPKP
jgi:hypothetical protein